MLAIASWTRRHVPESLWGLFAAANIAVMALVPEWNAIPVHNIWLSLTLLYCFRVWRTTKAIALVPAGMFAGTGGIMVVEALFFGERLDEAVEVPMLGAMFFAMVWHARRHQDILGRMRRLAECERDFASNASHELRTPITVARGHAELIRAAQPGGQIAADAEVILDELSHLSKISDRLLILAAADHPCFLARQPVELRRLISRTGARWKAAARRDWEISVTASGVLDADEERLEIALDAVLENAVKYTGEGERIAITAYAEGETAVIEVSDRGAGIEGEDLPRIFERFFRGEGERGGRQRGTGLGLAIVKSIAEAHDGRVTATSSVGDGTTIQIRIGGFSARVPSLSRSWLDARDLALERR